MDFTTGDLALVTNTAPGDHEWLGRTVEVVRAADFYVPDNPAEQLIYVRDIETGDEGGLFVKRLQRLPIITVEDVEGLNALPVGARLEDRLGVTLAKFDPPAEGYTGFAFLYGDEVKSSEAPEDTDRFWRTASLPALAETFGPFILKNPECLDEPAAEGAEPAEDACADCGVTGPGMTVCEECENAPLAEWEKELLDVMPSTEADDDDVPAESGEEAIDYDPQTSDVDMATNDIERCATPALIRAVLKTIKPGDRVQVVEGEVRVFDTFGKPEPVYLKPGAIVTVVNVGDDGGQYMPARTVLVRAGGIQQYVDVTSLHPLTEAQKAAVSDAYDAEHGGDKEAAARDLNEAHERKEQQMMKEFFRALGLDAEELDAEPETEPAPQDALAEARANFEAIEEALPEGAVARRAALIAVAKGVAESLTSDPSPVFIIEVARYLAGDEG